MRCSRDSCVVLRVTTVRWLCGVEGHYGEVLKGQYTDENGRVQDVAIKRLKQTMYEKFTSEFEKEFNIMVNLQHASIVGIIGRVIEREFHNYMYLFVIIPKLSLRP